MLEDNQLPKIEGLSPEEQERRNEHIRRVQFLNNTAWMKNRIHSAIATSERPFTTSYSVIEKLNNHEKGSTKALQSEFLVSFDPNGHYVPGDPNFNTEPTSLPFVLADETNIKITTVSQAKLHEVYLNQDHTTPGRKVWACAAGANRIPKPDNASELHSEPSDSAYEAGSERSDNESGTEQSGSRDDMSWVGLQSPRSDGTDLLWNPNRDNGNAIIVDESETESGSEEAEIKEEDTKPEDIKEDGIEEDGNSNTCLCVYTGDHCVNCDGPQYPELEVIISTPKDFEDENGVAFASENDSDSDEYDEDE